MTQRSNSFPIAKILLFFILLDVGLRLFRLDRVYRLLTRWAGNRPPREPSGVDTELLEEATRAVRRATRYYYRRRLDCLPRAISLFLLLRGQAVPVQLCWGVKKYPFAAHIWVEYLGSPVDGRTIDVTEFNVISRLS